MKWVRLLQTGLLLAALALVGLGFQPAPAEAEETCLTYTCDGGRYFCMLIYDPETGSMLGCRLSGP